MNNSALAEHSRKTNISVLFVMFVGVIIAVVLKLLSIQDVSIVVIATALLSACLSAVLLYTNKCAEAVEYILVLPFAITALTAFYKASNVGVAMVALMLCYSVAALYYSKLLVLVNGCFSFLSMVFIQYKLKPVFDNYSFLTIMILLFVINIALYFAAKRGGDLIIAANDKEQEAQALLLELEKTMGVIKDNTSSLNSDIIKCSENVSTVHEISCSMASTIQDITKGAVGQTESVTHISEMMKEADNKVYEIADDSKELSDVSTRAIQVVQEGTDKVELMDKQMKIINQAATKSYSTVHDLSSNLDEINSFLTSIKQIAEQTNLLALNAAIEAARAGESGKGFAVVADEVRKLAEESANTAGQINEVTNHIKEKTQNVMIETDRAQLAALEGEGYVKRVNESFENIKTAFNEISQYINSGSAKFYNLAEVFSEINGETENIASIAEEYAASTEELMATTEEHNSNIESINNFLQHIKDSSNKLQDAIKK